MRGRILKNGVEAPVYFDPFGRVFFVSTQRILLMFELVLGPFLIPLVIRA